MKYVRIILSFLAIVLMLILITLGLLYIKGPKILLIGEENITIDLNEEYHEPGYKISYLYKKLDNKIKINSNINNKKIGDYEVIYKLKYKNKEYSKSRKITVVDREEPIIELIDKDLSYTCPNKEYVEAGYSAYDNYDLDITDKVTIVKNNDTWIYKVKDSSGNESTMERQIIYQDNEKPILTLNGDSKITLYKGEQYKELGYTAYDNCDGDITTQVLVTGNVNSLNIGTYQINYSVKDSSGNEISTARTVSVTSRPVYSNKIIYLTFDDGPSFNITPKILDILKEEDVKATFFVTDQGRALDYIIKRAYDEGHTIAIHTSTHNYGKIYASEEAFFKDIANMGSIIKNITGVDSKIIRFPGGSSNTVSRFNKGIMTRLTKEVTNKGYLYYDWTIDSNDAAGANQTQIYNNVTKNMGYFKTNIVLMHDSNDKVGTLNALRDIIRYGKSRGFTFECITESTPQVKHRLNN